MHIPTSSILAFDAGGTKTHGALLSIDGQILSLCKGEGGNYQSCGLNRVQNRFKQWIGSLYQNTSYTPSDLPLGSIIYGLSGLDRPIDQCRLDRVLSPLTPHLLSPFTPLLVNDTDLILRAGTSNGVGIAVVSGTGSNCVGMNDEGHRSNIGGLGFEFGDGGGGMDLATSALRAAFRGQDHRDAYTLLTKRILDTFQLNRLDDLLDVWIDLEGLSEDILGIDTSTLDRIKNFDLAHLTPLLFECAQEGDDVAIQLLKEAGQELALSVNLLAKRLFKNTESFPVVVGGSVFQKGSTHSPFHQAFFDSIQTRYPHSSYHCLDAPPLLGAILLGFDQAVQRDLCSPLSSEQIENLKNELNRRLS